MSVRVVSFHSYIFTSGYLNRNTKTDSHILTGLVKSGGHAHYNLFVSVKPQGGAAVRIKWRRAHAINFHSDLPKKKEGKDIS